MSVKSCEKIEKSQVVLTIEVGAPEFEAAIEKAYQKMRKKINVPGFRPGKAPRKIIEGMYGTGVFCEEAINQVYPGAYAQAVEEQKLDDVGYPKIEIVEVGKDGLTFKALVSVRPEVKLGTYKGLTAAKDVAKVTDKDVDEELKPYIDRATRLVSVDRAAQNGDTVVIDFEGFDNGEAFEGGKGENYDLKLGSGSFVPGFEEQLVGTKAGDEKDLDITFPENYHPGLAGKAVVFHVKVKEVKEPQAPVVDDEFAKDVSEFDTLEAFRKDLEEKLLDRRQKEAQNDFENAVLDQLVENMECEIPDGMVDVQLDRMMENYAMELQSQGFSMEDYQKMMGVSGDVIRDSARPSALRQVQMQLALTAVAEAEKMEATDEEYEAEIKRMADQYKLEVEQVKAAVPAEDLKKDSDLVIAEAKVGKAKKKAAAKKTEKAEEAEGEEKPKRPRKKKTEEPEEPKAE